MRALLLLTALMGTGTPDPAWVPVEAGVEYGRFRLGARDSVAHVVRVDPGTAAVEVHSLAPGQEPLGVDAWARARGLVFAVNAGMFDLDRVTHIGYLKIRGEVMTPRIHPQYQSAALLHPREPSLPPFRILDADEEDLEAWAERYDTVIQNLRLIKAPGENRWSPTSRKWSEAALGEDSAGRMVFIFTRVPLAMDEWNRRMLDLPLGLVAAQHLEGGREAQIYLRLPGRELLETGGWMGSPPGIPNIIGIKSSK